jgi:hypothetical protein
MTQQQKYPATLMDVLRREYTRSSCVQSKTSVFLIGPSKVFFYLLDGGRGEGAEAQRRVLDGAAWARFRLLEA